MTKLYIFIYFTSSQILQFDLYYKVFYCLSFKFLFLISLPEEIKLMTCFKYFHNLNHIAFFTQCFWKIFYVEIWRCRTLTLAAEQYFIYWSIPLLMDILIISNFSLLKIMNVEMYKNFSRKVVRTTGGNKDLSWAA